MQRGRQSLIQTLAGSGHRAEPVTVEDTGTVTELASLVSEVYGRADIVVNTAGFTKPVPANDLEALDDALIDHLFQVNWRGQFAAIRAFRSLLEASGDGLVVNVSSIAAVSGVGSNIAYAAVKAGIDTMTKSLARVLAPKVRVMSVSPGVVDTDFVPRRDAAALAKIAPIIPARRIATADDVARAIAACATHLTYSTGSLVMSMAAAPCERNTMSDSSQRSAKAGVREVIRAGRAPRGQGGYSRGDQSGDRGARARART